MDIMPPDVTAALEGILENATEEELLTIYRSVGGVSNVLDMLCWIDDFNVLVEVELICRKERPHG